MVSLTTGFVIGTVWADWFQNGCHKVMALKLEKLLPLPVPPVLLWDSDYPLKVKIEVGRPVIAVRSIMLSRSGRLARK